MPSTRVPRRSRSRASDRRGGRRGPTAPRARPPRRRPAAADRVADDAPTRSGEGGGHSDRPARRARRSSTSRKASPSCASSRAAFIRATSPRQGLGHAVGLLAERAPLPVDVDVRATRLPQSVETALYFTVAEALTNVAKHANATRATRDGLDRRCCATAEIADDGRGGATTAWRLRAARAGRPARGDRRRDRAREPSGRWHRCEGAHPLGGGRRDYGAVSSSRTRSFGRPTIAFAGVTTRGRCSNCL